MINIHNSSLNSANISALSRGEKLILDPASHELRPVKWAESFVRFFNYKLRFRQDEEVAQFLIQYLKSNEDFVENRRPVEAIAKFVKTLSKSTQVFKELENLAFMHKCIIQIPSLKDLKKGGEGSQALLSFMKKNLLHYVIPKANSLHKETALLLDNEQVFVRAKVGNSFLNTVEHVTLILKHLPEEHSDRTLLSELKELLSTSSNQQNINRIANIRTLLELGHYDYLPLSAINCDDKGILVGQAFHAKGIEAFEHSRWTHLTSNFREESKPNEDTPLYKFRLITRRPPYVMKNSRWKNIVVFIRNIFNFRAHGHSWIELVEPVVDEKGQFLKQQNIYNVGYYYHPLDSKKRLESADPMAYMPIPREHIIKEEIVINKQKFQKLRTYIQEVQKLANNKNRSLVDQPSGYGLTDDDMKEICYLYKSTFKGTCLSFASTLKSLVKEINIDYRPCIFQWFFPKRERSVWKQMDTIIERTRVLRMLIQFPRFLSRLELPAFVAYIPPSIVNRK